MEGASVQTPEQMIARLISFDTTSRNQDACARRADPDNGFDPPWSTLSVGTEGPWYQEARMPVVIFGPGSVEQAHKPDEFVARDQVDECVAFMRKLMAHLGD